MSLRSREHLARLHVGSDTLEAWCRKWKIVELAFFGSILRDDFAPNSDVDLLVRFSEDARWSLFDHMAMEEEFSLMTGRSVDLVTRTSVERSENYLRRRAILDSAEVFYAA